MQNHSVSSYVKSLLTGSIASLAVSGANAAVLQVCKTNCPYTTIQGAVNAATTGDQVYVARGLYTENVTIMGKTVIVDGAGSGLTVVDGSAATQPVFTLGAPNSTGGASTGRRVTLKNLTITHGTASAASNFSGGGILVQGNAGLILASSAVVANTAPLWGGGIYIGSTTGPTSSIIDSWIEANTAGTAQHSHYVGGGGAGIDVAAGAAVVISGSAMVANTAFGDGGGLNGEIGSRVTLTNSTISGNSAVEYGTESGEVSALGGAIAADVISISGSSIYGNTANSGGGIYVHLSATKSTIVSTTITENTAGGGQEDPAQPLGGGVAVNAYLTGATGMLSLSHVYVARNVNLDEKNAADDVAVISDSGAARVNYADTIIGDPSNSGCIGTGCAK